MYVGVHDPVLSRSVGLGDEPVVEEGGEDAADDGGEDVEERRVPVVPGHDNRTERAGRVGRAAGRHPPIKTVAASANPTASGATVSVTPSSVATEITTKTRIQVMSASTTNPCRIPTPGTNPALRGRSTPRRRAETAPPGGRRNRRLCHPCRTRLPPRSDSRRLCPVLRRDAPVGLIENLPVAPYLYAHKSSLDPARRPARM